MYRIVILLLYECFVLFRQSVATLHFHSFLSVCLMISTSLLLDDHHHFVTADEFTIGYLTSLTGPNKFQGLSISGAVTYAIETINEDKTILPNHKLRFIWNNTESKRNKAVLSLTQQWNQSAIAFFGPEESCDVEAHIVAAWNLPMLSYRCVDSKVSKKDTFPTFARINPPDTQVLKSVISLLKYHQWKKFTIIYEDNVINNRWSAVAERLQEEAQENEMFVNEVRKFLNNYMCCKDYLDCCDSMIFVNLVEMTSKNTRVYVFLGEPKFLVRFMRALHKKNLLEDGNYIVIYVDLEEYSARESHRYIWELSEFPDVMINQQEFFDTARSVLVVAPSPPDRSSNYTTFTERTREYNKIKPFFFTVNEGPLRTMQKYVGGHAVYLYDAIILYARALHSVILNNPNDPQIHLNGTAIINEIISQKRYKSVTGLYVNIDKNGDAEGNFSVLAIIDEELKIGNTTFRKIMGPVGSFKYSNDNLPKFELLPSKSIDWKGGQPPPDEPPCGFDGDRCKPQSDNTREILAGFLVCLLVIVVVTAVISYRNWKYEQEIAGLLWKIYLRDLKLYQRGGFSFNSRTSIASQHSLESRLPLQWFTSSDLKLGSYNGTMVIVKSLRFSKKIGDLPRATKKEMRLMKEFRHDNINPFIGACLEPNQICIVSEYCGKGSLVDILGNDNIKLDPMLIASLVWDLIKAVTFLHDSDLKVHGNLKTSNCVVTSRWVLKVTDFGLHEFRTQAEPLDLEDYSEYWAKLWTAPELLRETDSNYRGTQKGDIYAFAIILFEIFGRQGPYLDEQIRKLTPQGIVYNVQHPVDEKHYRPDTSALVCQDYIITCMQDCWHEKPEIRPDIRHIHNRLKPIREGMKPVIIDNMLEILENYASRLEETVEERTAQLVEEKKKTEALLHRMLPPPVAEALMRGEYVTPESFDAVTIYFSDIVGFTEMSATSTPMEVVTFLNELYTVFDNTISNYDVYKVETIGDAYMVVSGLPIPNGNRHAGEIASMALDLLAAVNTFVIPHRPDQTLKLRIGIHTGPVVAGVVGKTMPRYCLFGDTVNTSSRMESNGEALKIHISIDCKEHLEKLGGYVIVERGIMHIKGKGKMMTFWLVNRTEEIEKAKEIQSAPSTHSFAKWLEGEGKRKSPKTTRVQNSGLWNRRFSSIPRVSDGELGSATGSGGLLSFLQGKGTPVSNSSCQDTVGNSCVGRRSRSPLRARSLMIRNSRRDIGSQDGKVVPLRVNSEVEDFNSNESSIFAEGDVPLVNGYFLEEPLARKSGLPLVNNNNNVNSDYEHSSGSGIRRGLNHVGNGNIPSLRELPDFESTVGETAVLLNSADTGVFSRTASDRDNCLPDQTKRISRLLPKNVGFHNRIAEKDSGKRWRSCDEIGKSTHRINFKNIFSGLFYNRDIIPNATNDNILETGTFAMCNDVESAM